VYVVTNVSEEHTVSVFRVEDGGDKFLRNIGNYLTRLHGIMIQNTTTQMFTAVRTSELTVTSIVDWGNFYVAL
jgi:hypothetical protein